MMGGGRWLLGSVELSMTAFFSRKKHVSYHLKKYPGKKVMLTLDIYARGRGRRWQLAGRRGGVDTVCGFLCVHLRFAQ